MWVLKNSHITDTWILLTAVLVASIKLGSIRPNTLWTPRRIYQPLQIMLTSWTVSTETILFGRLESLTVAGVRDLLLGPATRSTAVPAPPRDTDTRGSLALHPWDSTQAWRTMNSALTRGKPRLLRSSVKIPGYLLRASSKSFKSLGSPRARLSIPITVMSRLSKAWLMTKDVLRFSQKLSVKSWPSLQPVALCHALNNWSYPTT